MRQKLHEEPPDLRQAHARLPLNEVTVSDQEISISGSKAVLAKAASQDAELHVLQFSLLFESGAPERIRTSDPAPWRPARQPRRKTSQPRLSCRQSWLAGSVPHLQFERASLLGSEEGVPAKDLASAIRRLCVLQQ